MRVVGKHTGELEELEAEIRHALGDVAEAEEAERKATDFAGRMRVHIGNLLIRARAHWPERGPKSKGWGQLLERVGLTQVTAWRYMQLAGHVGNSSNLNEIIEGTAPAPTYAEAGIVPPGPHPNPDRDAACTPRELAELLGAWDLDPCGNERSHIQAQRVFLLDRGEDGLELAKTIVETTRAFINPPYSDVMPWVQAYLHTRFCFLLKFDPSTKWCELLLAHTELVLFPKRTRIEFEAPPGVEYSSNQFPHGLFFARQDDAPRALRETCFMFHAA